MRIKSIEFDSHNAEININGNKFSLSGLKKQRKHQGMLFESEFGQKMSFPSKKGKFSDVTLYSNDKIYFNGFEIIKCTKTIPMPNSINSLFVYDNSSFQGYDLIVKSRPEGFGLNSLHIEILIDTLYKDVTPLNPCYIEIEID